MTDCHQYTAFLVPFLIYLITFPNFYTFNWYHTLKHSILILTLLRTIWFHLDSLLRGPKSIHSPSVSFSNFLISYAILSHISLLLSCSYVQPSFKIFSWKQHCFSSFKFHHLILVAQPWHLLFSLLLTLTSITNTICWIVKLSPDKTLSPNKSLS